MSFFYDELFEAVDTVPESFDAEDVKAVYADFAASYDETVEQNDWFANIKSIAEKNGFCPDMKQYKANPEAFNQAAGAAGANGAGTADNGAQDADYTVVDDN